MYAIRENGSFRAVSEGMDLYEGETLYEELPQWVLDILAEWRRVNLG